MTISTKKKKILSKLIKKNRQKNAAYGALLTAIDICSTHVANKYIDSRVKKIIGHGTIGFSLSISEQK